MQSSIPLNADNTHSTGTVGNPKSGDGFSAQNVSILWECPLYILIDKRTLFSEDVPVKCEELYFAKSMSASQEMLISIHMQYTVAWDLIYTLFFVFSIKCAQKFMNFS